MRLIDADTLKETIASNVYPVADAFNSRDYGMFWAGGIEKAIDEQPTIIEFEGDITKVIVKGEEYHKQLTTTWLGNFCPYRCEYCGRYVDSKERYCPNCGRKAVNYE